MGLSQRRCVPCEGGVEPLERGRIRELLAQLSGWEIDAATGALHKRLEFVDFVATMVFVNGMAALAEAEGHHPDFCVHYNRLDITLLTHSISGLSENDFILAAKIDRLVPA